MIYEKRLRNSVRQSEREAKKMEIIKEPQTAVTPWQSVQLDRAKIEIIKKTICPPTASQVDFEFFVNWCQRTGLDPMIKQAYLIERWDKSTNTKRHEPMVAESGFAARADSLPDFRGMRSGVVYEGDTFSINETHQLINHEWSPEGRKGKQILGAWAHGKRDGRVTEITWITLESRIQKTKDGTVTRFWATDPAGQIRKCARADQYRRLYPNIFGDWHHEAEAQVIDVDAAAPRETPPQSKTKALEAKLQARKETEAIMTFGPKKNQLLAGCADADLVEALALAEQQMSKANGDEPWIAGVEACVKQIKNEQLKRQPEAKNE